jgi:hypothetical protein
MKGLGLAGMAFLTIFLATSQGFAQQDRKAKSPSIKGDVGAIELEKNYIILVTPEGKLHTMSFTDKTKVTELKEERSTLDKINPGDAATVTYIEKGEDKIIEAIQFKGSRRE